MAATWLALFGPWLLRRRAFARGAQEGRVRDRVELADGAVQMFDGTGALRHSLPLEAVRLRQPMREAIWLGNPRGTIFLLPLSDEGRAFLAAVAAATDARPGQGGM